jgi:SAM-dependent methyltransferase
VRRPAEVMREIGRVLSPGGFAHVVAPFCHPLHEYPEDFRRFTPAELAGLAGDLEAVETGWRTGPTATLLVFILEYAKLWLRWQPLRALAHGVLGWALFPARYLDTILLRRPEAGRMGNHCYAWFRKRVSA